MRTSASVVWNRDSEIHPCGTAALNGSYSCRAVIESMRSAGVCSLTGVGRGARNWSCASVGRGVVGSGITCTCCLRESWKGAVRTDGD